MTTKTAAAAFVPVAVDGETWFFPQAYVDPMKKKGLSDTQITEVQKAWVALMKEAGYDPEMVKNNKASIVTSAVPAFQKALSQTLAKPSGTVVSEEGETTTGAVTSTTGKFATTADEWFGLKRIRPAHPEAPKLPFKFIDGSVEMAERARIFSQGRRPLLFVGESGVGKTTEAYHYAEELGCPAIRMGHDAHTEVEDILGKTVRRPDGSIEFEYGPLPRAFKIAEECGYCIYIADELNALKAGPLMVYQMVNEGGDLIINNNNGERIKRPKGFRWIGTMNPTSYAGTNELSLAQLGRPFVFNVDYPDETKEAKILAANFPSLDKNTVKNLVRFANEVRARKKKDPENVVYTVSTRDLVKIAELVTELDFNVRRAVDICITNTVTNLGDKAETDAVATIVNSRFTVGR